MHISLRGLQQVQGHSNTFPYDAISPISGLQTTFSSIEDVYSMLLSCYQECIEQGFYNLGEALYTQLPFFADFSLLARKDIQDSIKDYKFCKLFNCPPFKSLDDTPDRIKDSFFIIDQEYNNCVIHIRENKKDK